MGVPPPILELGEHHFGVRLVVRRADMVRLGRHGLHPAAHFGGVQGRVELPFNLRGRWLRGLGANRACAESGGEHNGTGNRVAHETLPDCDRHAPKTGEPYHFSAGGMRRPMTLRAFEKLAPEKYAGTHDRWIPP